MAAVDRVSSIFAPEYKLFWIGTAMISLALGSIYFGVVPGRGGCTYRSKSPKSFWVGVSIYFLGGAFFWLSFLYRSN